MTTRADLIETAAKTLYVAETGDSGDDWPDDDSMPWSEARNFRTLAAVVLDAVLPQVTTVEDLEALPIGSIVVGDGNAWRIHRRRDHEVVAKGTTGYGESFAYLALHKGPLTVVWQPQPGRETRANA